MYWYIGERSVIWLSSLRDGHGTDPMTSQRLTLWKIMAKSSPLNLTRSSMKEWSCVWTQSRTLSAVQRNFLCVHAIFCLMDDCVIDCFARNWRHTNGSMPVMSNQADVCCVYLHLLLRHYSISFRIVLDGSAFVFSFQHFSTDLLSFDDSPLLVCFFYCEEKLLSHAANHMLY
jgi:hypothetical protein